MHGGGSQQRARPIEVAEIESLARDRIEEIAWELLPNARRDGRHLCVGSIAGEPGQSLKINLSGPHKGLWTDFTNPDADDGKGGAIGLVKHVLFGGDATKAIQWLKSRLGLDGMDPARLATVRAQAREASIEAARKAIEIRQQKRRRAVALWMSGKPIAGTPAEAYLRGRGIDRTVLGKWPGALRFHAEVWNREQGVKIPALLAAMFTPAGEHVATHRTYLRWCERRGWSKLDSPNAKMVLGQCGGAFVPLRKGASGKSMSDMPAGEPIHIAEGIEDALSVAMARPELRIVAGYSLGNIGSILFPEAMGELVLLADRDRPGSKAVDALERVIARQQGRGARVRIAMPPPGIKDFNEWLVRGGMQDAPEGAE